VLNAEKVFLIVERRVPEQSQPVNIGRCEQFIDFRIMEVEIAISFDHKVDAGV
jgi:hypothetical protein